MGIKITKKATEKERTVVVTSDRSVVLSDDKPEEKGTSKKPRVILLGGYVHKQTNSSILWYVKHNLLRFPSVRVEDKQGKDIMAEIEDVDNNSLYIKFNKPKSGVAYIN